jgi:hypothetical protein
MDSDNQLLEQKAFNHDHLLISSGDRKCE